MAGENDTNKDKDATAAAAGTGLTKEEVQSILTEHLKPVNEAIQAMAGNQKIFADTLAKLPPAGAAAVGGGGGGGEEKGKEKDGQPKFLTAEEAQALFTETLKKDRETQQQTTADQAARAEFIKGDRSGLARIAPFAAAMGFDVSSKLGADKAKWPDEAKTIATGWETFVKDNKIAIPDVGGGARDGGNAPGAGGNAAENAAKPGSWIKMPA